jgi:hypothetical protein
MFTAFQLDHPTQSVDIGTTNSHKKEIDKIKITAYVINSKEAKEMWT